MFDPVTDSEIQNNNKLSVYWQPTA